jgi:hypothetical protein
MIITIAMIMIDSSNLSAGKLPTRSIPTASVTDYPAAIEVAAFRSGPASSARETMSNRDGL